MAFQKDDPHAISQAQEIQSILLAMLSRRTLVRLDVPGQTVSVISTLLGINPESGVLWLDNASEDRINTQLLRASDVRLQGQLDGILIEFSGPLQPTLHDDRPAFAMNLPSRIRRLQRRQFFRVEVPAHNPAACEIEHDCLPGGRARFPVCDISAGGLRLLDHDHFLTGLVGGTRFARCCLQLSEIAQLHISLQLLRTSSHTPEGGKPLQLAAFRYFDLAPNHQITIQQYIVRLERAILARRWGTD